jgi:hypothetical protein
MFDHPGVKNEPEIGMKFIVSLPNCGVGIESRMLNKNEWATAVPDFAS